MNQKKKIIFLSSLIIGILTLTLGITFSIFTFNKTSTNSKLVVGDIYMHYNETNQIVLENAIPFDIRYKVNNNMTTEELNKCVTYLSNTEGADALSDGETWESYCNGTGTYGGVSFQEDLDDGYYSTETLAYLEENNIVTSTIYTLPYFEFTIDGKNTTKDKDIWYEIVLSHGDSHETRTTRIRDDLLKFMLVEIKDGVETVVVNNKSYSDLNNHRIWVDTINKNTTSEVIHTYRLYMWIDSNTVIGNIDQDYTFEEWTDVYASIKVNVTGDFEEKRIKNATEFKNLVKEESKNYIEEDGIVYISGSSTDIDFNYVWYSGKLWRITAINPDGTMKMITDDLITSISYNSSGNLNFYTDNENKSYMYQWLNEDFLDTLYNYENIIVTDSKWNSLTTEDITTKITEGAEGVTTTTSPVGLLNSYEYYISQFFSHSNGYLNIGYMWWLLNPYSSSRIWNVARNGDNYHHYPTSTYGCRPSINLKSGIKLSGGSGTKTDPYTILGDKGEVTAGTTLLNTRSSGEYVKFNNELYRIVSIENNMTKINKNDYIRDESYTVLEKPLFSGETFGLGTTDNYWDYYLNNTWYNTLNTAYQNMIVESTYYLGIITGSEGYKNAVCATASNTVTTKDCEKTTSTWTGLVGLPRYGEMFASQQGSGSSSSSDMWLITPSSDVYYWTIDNVNTNDGIPDATNSNHAGRPSINLKSNIKITGGNGTKDNPFEISL